MTKGIIFKYLHFSAMIIILVIAMNICGFATDQWKIIQTQEFQIVGNTYEKNLQDIYLSINQIEMVFSQIFNPIKTHRKIPTNVIVFKNDKVFTPFKPFENGEIKDWVAGYFQPGEDVNYIVLSAKATKKNTTKTIFHEYTHSLVNNYFGQENVPPWINEGLAEYFEHLLIRKKNKIILGYPGFSHGRFDKNLRLKPLDEFFKINYKYLKKQNEKEIESFYAQSWLLIHYILNGHDKIWTDKLKLFLNAVIKGDPPAIAYREIIGGSLSDLESGLENYLLRRNFPTRTLELKNGLRFETKPEIKQISVGEEKAFQGDLFYNMNRFEEAEIYLQKALQINPKSSLANTSLGLLKMKEGDFDKAKKHLETALESDSDNYLIHYRFAFILSREDLNNFGYIRKFDEITYEKMRNSLQSSISLNPYFSESLYLFAFINLVQDRDYDEGIRMLEKALKISPENQWYRMRLSEFYYRKENLEKAEEIARQVAEKTSDSSLVEYAQRNLEMIKVFRANLEKREQDRKNAKFFVRDSDGILTEEEQRILIENSVVEALNQMVRKPLEGEERMLGRLSKIICEKKGVFYLLQTKEKAVKFKSDTFENLRLSIFNYSWTGENFGCGSSLAENLVIVTYRPQDKETSSTIGEIVGIEFVPNYFKFPNPINTSNN